MSSRRIFSWPKRQTLSDPRSSYNGPEAKPTPKSGRKVPSELKIVTTQDDPSLLSPLSATYMVNAASTLQAALNDILHSPVPCPTAGIRSASSQKPLPDQPRYHSLPSNADLQAELPGSILRENQGFPPDVKPEKSATVHPIYHDIQQSAHPAWSDSEDQEDFSALLSQFPRPLIHAKSVPNLGHHSDNMPSSRSSNTLNPKTVPKPSPLRIQHNKSLSEMSPGQYSKTDRVAPSLSTNPSMSGALGNTNPLAVTRPGTSKTLQPSSSILAEQLREERLSEGSRAEPDPAAAPSPITKRNKRVEDFKATIATQNRATAKLQAQCADLKASHETYTESLIHDRSAKVSSLKNTARAHDEQLARRPTLNQASSTNVVALVDTNESLILTSKRTEQTAEIDPTSPSESLQTTLEEQQQIPPYIKDNPEMENLKRKLSYTRRPETASRNLLPELNQYKQNNVALQKQIESLMAKLNKSKQGERELQASLDCMTNSRDEWQKKSEDAEKTARSAQALQNTIDHLQNRLETANMEKLDAREQLFNIQAQKSPFDIRLLSLQIPTVHDHEQGARTAQMSHTSMSTVFSSDSPSSYKNESQDLSSLNTFAAHIKRLQEQIRQKDAQVLNLEKSKKGLEQELYQVRQEQHTLTLQMDIQSELLRKTRRTDAQIEQLRAAVMDREAVISERDKSIQAIERELEYHKLLLEAQIRRQATISLHTATDEAPLPELSEINTRADIDKWVEKLHERLAKENPMTMDQQLSSPDEARLANLRHEIDFYVREIIYYKLDIRGYKSDIKKLKKATAQLSSFASRASDLDSETSSLRPAATPVATPEHGSSGSPAISKLAHGARSLNRPITPPTSNPGFATKLSYIPDGMISRGMQVPLHLDLQTPMTPGTSSRTMDIQTTQRKGYVGSRLPMEQEQPKPPSHYRNKLSEILANISLSAPTTPQKHKRSMSESIITSKAITEARAQALERDCQKSVRSASVSEPNKSKIIPDRPSRPHYGLFDSPESRRTAIFSPVDAPTVSSTGPSILSAEKEMVTEVRLSRSHSNSSSGRAALQHILKEAPVNVARPHSPAASQPIFDPRRGYASAIMPSSSARLETSRDRRPNTASSSSIPFIIGIGSPHNPALTTLAPNMQPTPCSITRNAPPSTNPGTSHIGVGGTMASSTPAASPISPTDNSMGDSPLKSASAKATYIPQVRKLSFSRKRDDRWPKTPSHSRSASGGSIRTVIRLPKARDKDEEAQKVTKDNIGVPQPLGSPFNIERSMSLGEDDHRMDNYYRVGEAI